MPHRLTKIDPDNIIAVSNRTTEIGATAGVIGWLASINWLGLIGVVVAVSGFVVSWWYQDKRNKREAERHELEVIERRARIREMLGENDETR